MSVEKPTIDAQSGKVIRPKEQSIKWYEILIAVSVVMYWIYSVAWIGVFIQK